jgi:hypothetical protein
MIRPDAGAKRNDKVRLSHARVLALFVVAFLAATCTAQTAGTKPGQASEEISQVLSWLPADTESIVVANGPFLLPDMSPSEEYSVPSAVSVEDLKDDFEHLPLALIGFNNGLLANHLQGQKVMVAIEGTRHFREPEGLGGALFEGCSIAVFARDVSDRAASFLKDSARNALPSEQIEDQKVAVFQELLDSDMWTILVDFPKPNVALACTNRDYLREAIVRMRGASGAMALPEHLPEWKYADMRARFWGLRHFDNTQAKEDPTSPFAGDKTTKLHDEHAIGLTFRFDPYKSREATITYLSGDKNILPKLKESELWLKDEPAAEFLNIEFRERDPGVAEVTYELMQPKAVNLFLYLLTGSLGHLAFRPAF